MDCSSRSVTLSPPSSTLVAAGRSRTCGTSTEQLLLPAAALSRWSPLSLAASLRGCRSGAPPQRPHSEVANERNQEECHRPQPIGHVPESNWRVPAPPPRDVLVSLDSCSRLLRASVSLRPRNVLLGPSRGHPAQRLVSEMALVWHDLDRCSVLRPLLGQRHRARIPAKGPSTGTSEKRPLLRIADRDLPSRWKQHRRLRMSMTERKPNFPFGRLNA